jgi:hypothetical protein
MKKTSSFQTDINKNDCCNTLNKTLYSLKYHKSLFLIIFSLFVGTNAFSATFYVATNGNNANNGTSTSTPWKTINYAVNYSGLVAGDVIFVRGGTYYERAVMTKSGNATSRITVKNYAGETPIIDGTGVIFVANESHQGLFDVTASYVTIDGFTVQNSNPGINEANATGICVRGPYVRDVTINNCVVSNTRSSGIAVWGQTSGSDYSGCQNIIIENCDISNAINDGYQEHLTIAKGVDNFTVRNNKVHDGSQNSNPRSPNLPIGIDAKVNVRNGKIYGNEVYNLPLSNGIYVDSWDVEAYNIEIYNNIIYNVGHTGIPIGGEEGGTTHDIKVYNNLVYNNTEFGLGVWGSNTSKANNVYNVYFYNNTVYGNSYYAAWVNNSSTGTIVFKNNIFSQNGWGNAVNLMSANKSNVTVSHNITNGSQNAFHTGSEYVKGTNNNDSDPLFINTGNNNYRLQANSPAVNTGTSSLAANTDLDGKNRPIGNGYDVGGYEYGTPTVSDVISSVDGPNTVNPGSTVAVNISYSASTNRDIYVQLVQSNPWVEFSTTTKADVSSGSGTVAINLPIASNIPVATGSYEYYAWITTDGGDWNARLNDGGEQNISCVVSNPCNSCNVPGNILNNPGFENSLTTGWTDDWGNSTRVSDTYYSGSYSLKVGTGQGGRAQILTSGFTVGSEYKLTAYCKLSATGAPSGTNIGVICKNSSGVRTGTFTSSDITSTSWTEKSIEFTIPANTTRLEVNVWYPGGSPSVYVDDFVLVKNMLQNPGFENDLSIGWTSDWGNSTRVTSPIRSGSYALKVGPAQEGRAQILTSGFTIGNTYTISAYGRLSTSGAPLGTFIGAICKNSSGDRTGTFTSSDITTTTWVQKTVTFQVPANTTSIEVHVWYPGGTPSVYFDDFAMVPGSNALKSSIVTSNSEVIKTEKVFTIYPNPNSSRILNIKTLGLKDEKMLSIYDLSGKLVFNTSLGISEEHKIDLENLNTSGIYIVKIKTKNQEYIQKLLLK